MPLMRWLSWILRSPFTDKAGRPSTKILEDDLRALLGDYGRGRVGIAGRNRRHDGGIDNPQTLDAVNTQARINHRFRIRGMPHLCRPHGMEDRGADISGGGGEGIGVIAHVSAG